MNANDSLSRLFRLFMITMPSSACGEPPPGHGFHPPMPNLEYLVRIQTGGERNPNVTEAVVKLPSNLEEAELDQVIALPPGTPQLRLRRYLPRAVLEQTVTEVDAAGGEPAVEVVVAGPTQEIRRWLVAKDPARNRLISLIGTWRYLSAVDKEQRDDLLQQFENELTREPTLSIARSDSGAIRKMSATPGAAQDFEDLGCRVRVTAFHPHFAYDETSKQPVNKSAKKLNPAAKIEIEASGRTEERWVFSRFPGFKAKEQETLPYLVTLDCPAEAQGDYPDFAIVTMGRNNHEIWSRYQGRVETAPLKLDEKVKVVPSQYAFHLSRYLPSARLTEAFVPGTRSDAVSALKLEVADGDQVTPLWVGLNQQRIVSMPSGIMTIVFVAREGVDPATPQGAHP